MADVSHLTVGGTTYDIKPATGGINGTLLKSSSASLRVYSSAVSIPILLVSDFDLTKYHHYRLVITHAGDTGWYPTLSIYHTKAGTQYQDDYVVTQYSSTPFAYRQMVTASSGSTSLNTIYDFTDITMYKIQNNYAFQYDMCMFSQGGIVNARYLGSSSNTAPTATTDNVLQLQFSRGPYNQAAIFYYDFYGLY